MGGRGSSRFITILHRGGSPQFITILHRGGLQNLLQYYSFERKMEGYNPFSALNKLKGFHFILFNADLCLRVLSHIWKKCRKYAFLGGPPRLLRYYIGGVIEIYYNTTKGGGVFPIYYNITRGRGGSLGTPNLYYVIYGRPLTTTANQGLL